MRLLSISSAGPGSLGDPHLSGLLGDSLLWRYGQSLNVAATIRVHQGP